MSSFPIEMLQGLRPLRRNFAEGAFLFHRGDSIRFLHFVTAGEAHLIRHQEDGAALTLQRAGPGSVLAEASVFSDIYHCDAIAVHETSTLAVPCATVRARLADNGEFAQAWGAYLSRAVQSARLRAEILSLRTVAQRLDTWLAANDDKLPAKGSWKAIANEIGVSAPALYREIAKRDRRMAVPPVA
jgi:CRP-like cAMP-binding protein